jgi:hypothetical protein
MHKRLVIAAVLCTVLGNVVAAEKGMSSHLQRPADIVTERVDRSQRPAPHLTGAVTHSTLTQAEVVRLAKTVAKKETGKKFDDYEVNSVIFDPLNREWTISFLPKPPRRATEECLTVFVKDDTKETRVHQCS